MTSRALQLARYLGAAALLGVGIDHIQQYFGAHYSAIPTIGTLFALNFAASVLLAAGLIFPIERVLPRRANVVLGGLAAAGIGVAAGSLAALFVSEQTPLFGWMELGYRQAIDISIVLEAVTVLVLELSSPGSSPGEAPPPRPRPLGLKQPEPVRLTPGPRARESAGRADSLHCLMR